MVQIFSVHNSASYIIDVYNQRHSCTSAINKTVVGCGHWKLLGSNTNFIHLLTDLPSWKRK